MTAVRRPALTVERTYRPDPARCVAAIVKLLTYRPPAPTDTADDRQPRRTGDQSTMNNASASRPRDCAGVAEDSHRAQHTSTVDES